MRDSLFTTLVEFPILVGWLKVESSGKTVVVVDENNLNMPELKETQSDIHFDDLKSVGFSWSAMPQTTVTVRVFAAAGDQGCIKLVNVHIVRLKDNSGVVLFVNVPHYVVDGIGYCAFINQWAKNSTQLQNGIPNSSVHAKPFDYDRQAVSRCLSSSRSTPDDAAYPMYTTESYLARWLAWLTPESRGSVLNAFVALDSIEAHVFHICTASINSLHKSLCAEITGGLRISDNDIITALLTMVLAQGEKQVETNSSIGGLSVWHNIKSAVVCAAQNVFKRHAYSWATTVTVDIRGRVDTPSATNYTGNMVMGTVFSSPICLVETEITGESLTHVATGIRRAVSQTDGPYIKKLIDVISKETSSYAQALGIVSMGSKILVITNQSRFPLYTVDFGSGIPAWVSPIPKFYNNFASVLPRHPSADGYHIYISTRSATMQAVLNNTFWQTMARLVY
ncbi:hypothetical protein GGF37_002366 [Kickxella alabastrina]|nr:hypothetical protein GGF37_002366 [Kickxella alabastrina]